MKLSIVCTVYNAEKFVEESLNSIFSHPPKSEFEVIIVNDGSTDGTRDILLKYLNKYTNVRLLENQYNEGIPVSRNRALISSSGEYIAIHDADDVSLPGRFDKQINFLNDHRNITIVGSYAIKISESGEVIGSMTYPPKNTQQAFGVISRFKLNPIIDPSCMYRRDTIVDAGGYSMDPDIRTALDFELWCRLLVSGHHLANIQEPLIKYRINPNGVTRKENEKMMSTTDEIWSKFKRRNFKRLVLNETSFDKDIFTEYRIPDRCSNKDRQNEENI